MGDFLLAVGASATCPHGGPMQIVPTNARVLAGGTPAATVADQFLISGCAFTIPSGVPQPCVPVTFGPATKVLIGGTPAVLQSSTAVCLSATGTPAGPPTVSSTQMKVQGL